MLCGDVCDDVCDVNDDASQHWRPGAVIILSFVFVIFFIFTHIEMLSRGARFCLESDKR